LRKVSFPEKGGEEGMGQMKTGNEAIEMKGERRAINRKMMKTKNGSGNGAEDEEGMSDGVKVNGRERSDPGKRGEISRKGENVRRKPKGIGTGTQIVGILYNYLCIS
jgi:hypothetical protein